MKLLASLVRAAVTAAVQRLLKRVLPEDTDETEPIPLTHRSVENIQGQIRSATERRVKPPPPPSSRYDR